MCDLFFFEAEQIRQGFLGSSQGSLGIRRRRSESRNGCKSLSGHGSAFGGGMVAGLCRWRNGLWRGEVMEFRAGLLGKVDRGVATAQCGLYVAGEERMEQVIGQAHQ